MKATNVVSFVLAGGNGTRLLPLTRQRCKPAVSFGANFRIIDFTLMNCCAAGLGNVYLLTQHKSRCLEEYCRNRWRFLNSPGNGRLSTVPSGATTPTGPGAYRGTADAVYKNIGLVERSRAEVVLILSGDHVYHASYKSFIARHLALKAPLTVLTGDIAIEQASSFGVVEISGERITRFIEKPADPTPYSKAGKCHINLGVYCFKPDFLLEQLLKEANRLGSHHDFGRDIVPRTLCEGEVYSCPLREVSGRSPYWRDVGTIDSFFDANMDLLRSPPTFQLSSLLWNPDLPFERWVPERRPAKARVHGRLVCGHNVVAADAEVKSPRVVNCVISSRARVENGAELENCVVLPGAKVGAGAKLHRVVVEEGARVPSGTVVGLPGAVDGHFVSAGGVAVILSEVRCKREVALETSGVQANEPTS